MDVRLLGPVQVVAGDGPRDVVPPQRAVVLAALSVDAGRLVTVDTMVERVWGDQPADGARRALHAHISRLRRLLADCAEDDEAVAVVRRAGGYVLQLATDRVDLHRFRALVQHSAQLTGTPAEQALVLRGALDLVRGEPLAGLPGAWAARTRRAWRQEQHDATLSWARAEVRAGNPATVVGSLAGLVEENPFWEPLIAVQLRALHAVGRAPEALELYATTRARLVADLGTEPGPELRQAHQSVLRDEPTPERNDAVRHQPAPAQLPRDVRGFAGREKVIGELDALLPAATGAVVISAIGGTAGVGKTAVAVHWAHRVAPRFPDGQLYLNLRGFDAHARPVRPEDAIRHCLEALGIAPQRIPDDLDARAALYRSQLAGRRVLILLDNARDPAQVRPLLPGAPGCLVVVTSRHQLTGLVAADAARPLTLDLLTEEESRELLTHRLGAQRVAAEPDAVDQIIARCARLPLALAVVAARAAIRPHLPLRAIGAELAATGNPLTTLASGDDPDSDVRAVFSWSYRALSLDAARVFRCLGRHPGPDVSAPVVATMARLTEPRPALDELVTVNLVVEHVPGRYRFHDLLRAYAADLAEAEDDVPGRLLDHYLHCAHAAARVLDEHRRPIAIGAPPAGYRPESFTDRGQAMSWFSDEHAVLLAAVEYAAATDHNGHTWRLAWCLSDYLDWRGHWHDWTATLRAALTAGQRSGDLVVQGWAHLHLSHAHRRFERADDAETELGNALDAYERAGDEIGQAHTHRAFSDLREYQSRPADALTHAQAALGLFQANHDPRGEASTLNAIGWLHALLHHYEPAIAACRTALARLEELGDQYGQAACWDSLGYAYHQLGRHVEALACYDRSVGLIRLLGDRYTEADILRRIADTREAAGQSADARAARHQALAILIDLDHPDAADVRSLLA